MKISAQGLIDMAYEEGVCLEPYKDAVGVWTIGIGHTDAADGGNLRATGKITLQRAFDMYRQDMVKYNRSVEKVYPSANQQQTDALISFCYNLGEGNLRTLVAGRSPQQIADGMLAYNKGRVNGVLTVLSGLAKRRASERDIFLHGKYQHLDGMVPLFPVSDSGYPVYSQRKMIDARPYLSDGAIPAPMPEPVPPKPVRDENIAMVQRGLNGYFKLSPPLTEDGLYGPLTDKAVERLALKL